MKKLLDFLNECKDNIITIENKSIDLQNLLWDKFIISCKCDPGRPGSPGYSISNTVEFKIKYIDNKIVKTIILLYDLETPLDMILTNHNFRSSIQNINEELQINLLATYNKNSEYIIPFIEVENYKYDNTGCKNNIIEYCKIFSNNVIEDTYIYYFDDKKKYFDEIINDKLYWYDSCIMLDECSKLYTNNDYIKSGVFDIRKHDIISTSYLYFAEYPIFRVDKNNIKSLKKKMCIE